MKTMIVHDEAESDTAITPSKDGTLIVRQVREAERPVLVQCFVCHHSSIPSVCTLNDFIIIFLYFLLLYLEKEHSRSFETCMQIRIFRLLALLPPFFFPHGV